MQPSPTTDNEHRAERGPTRGGRVLVMVVAMLVGTLTIAVDETQPRPAAAASCSGATYTVVSGDSWSVIASRLRVAMSALLAANNATVTTTIHPGQTLCVPAGASAPTTTQPSTSSTPTTSSPSTTSPPPVVVPLSNFPVQGTCWYTDTWGAARSGGRKHEGVDIIAKAGQYAYAVRDGVLTKKYIDAPGTLAGNGWRLTADDGTYFFYAHFMAFPAGLEVGSKVKAGQIIGFIGMTGSAGTNHLHFEIHPGGGKAINPTPSVRAVDGCKTTVVPPQPGGVIPPIPSPTTTSVPVTTTPATTAPATTTPVTTAPVTTAPATTPPVTTAPVSTVPVTTAPSAGTGTAWRFIAPVLALETNGSRLAAGTAKTVSTVLPGVPADPTGVLVRVVARNVAAAGAVTVHPCGSSPKGTASLAINPARLNATVVMVPVADRQICVTSTVTTDVRLEVVAVHAADGVGVQPVVATRALDTRSVAPIAANGTKGISPKRLGTPSGAKAVTTTITLVAAGATPSSGSIGIGPCGGTPWIVAFKAVAIQSFSAVVRTNDAGICVSSTAAVHVVVDVTAAWTSGAPNIAASGPTRLLDTRRGAAVGPAAYGVPVPSGATTVQLTVTAVGGAKGAAIFVWPCNAPKPSAAAGTTVALTATTMVVTVATTGGVCMSATSATHVIVDLQGRAR